jgi:hypothetical protein
MEGGRAKGSAKGEGNGEGKGEGEGRRVRRAKSANLEDLEQPCTPHNFYQRELKSARGVYVLCACFCVKHPFLRNFSRGFFYREGGG